MPCDLVALLPGRLDAQSPPPESDQVAAILTPRHQAVLSAEIPGRVVAVNREFGERFAAGDLLVQLDELTYRVNRQKAEAELAAAEQDLVQVRKLAEERSRERRAAAVLAAARANLAATQRLYDNQQTSQLDLENARRDVTAAEAECELAGATSAKELTRAQRELAIAQGNCELARGELEACAVRAPYAGRVARVIVQAYELVQRGTPVMEVVDDGLLLAKFLLPSALFRSVQIGQEVSLTVSETGQIVIARVSHIAAVLDPASVTFEVYAELDNPVGDLRAGMNGTLSLAQFRRP
jgi:multidrug resistance efflux pump